MKFKIKETKKPHLTLHHGGKIDEPEPPEEIDYPTQEEVGPQIIELAQTALGQLKYSDMVEEKLQQIIELAKNL